MMVALGKTGPYASWLAVGERFCSGGHDESDSIHKSTTVLIMTLRLCAVL